MKKQTKNLINKFFPKFLINIFKYFYHWYLRIIFPLFNRGKNFYCPICDRYFGKLVSDGLDLPIFKEKQIVGGGFYKNALCPVCLSDQRERLAYLYLKNKTNIFNSNLKVLHIAPERNIKKKLQENKKIDYTSFDKVSDWADLKGDVMNMSFENDSFDVVICNHVLEHVDDDIKAISEIYRILKPNGWAMLQVPIALDLDTKFEDYNIKTEKDREKFYAQKDHQRLYGKDYDNILENLGFKVDIVDLQAEIGQDSIKNYVLFENEKIYIANK